VYSLFTDQHMDYKVVAGYESSSSIFSLFNNKPELHICYELTIT